MPVKPAVSVTFAMIGKTTATPMIPASDIQDTRNDYHDADELFHDLSFKSTFSIGKHISVSSFSITSALIISGVQSRVSP